MDNGLLKTAAGVLAILSVALIGLRTIALDEIPGADNSLATPAQQGTPTPALVTQGGQVSYHIPKETVELRLSASRDGAGAVLVLRFNAGRVQAVQTENNGLVAQIRGAPAPGADVQVLVTDMEGNPLDGVQVIPDVVLSAPASTSTPVPPPTATPVPAFTPMPTATLIPTSAAPKATLTPTPTVKPKPTRTPAPTHTPKATPTKEVHGEDRDTRGDDDRRGHGNGDDDDDDNSGRGGGGGGGRRGKG